MITAKLTCGGTLYQRHEFEDAPDVVTIWPLSWPTAQPSGQLLSKHWTPSMARIAHNLLAFVLPQPPQYGPQCLDLSQWPTCPECGKFSPSGKRYSTICADCALSL